MRSVKTIIATVSVSLMACLAAPAFAGEGFTIAVIPDTQNYLDYRHQTAEGYPVDGQKIFLEQMDYIARNLKANGGDLAFVVSVGDVWQHPSILIDPEHARRGFKRAPSPFLDRELPPTDRALTFELPLARQGFERLGGETPFGVAPGNHDYDAFWTDSNHPPKPNAKSKADLGVVHAGGLKNFTSVFGAQSAFFKGKPWYVASHDGGADSAQIFEGGGYRFLHIALQYDAPDASLAWAEKVVAQYPGLPTIISTHNFLNNDGQRFSDPVADQHASDPQDNTPQMVWDKLIRRHDQIFMVLCGHQSGQAFRADKNDAGHMVYQILADYQSRNSSLKEAGLMPKPGDEMGDGWVRFMHFDLGDQSPTLTIRTYSTFYKIESTDMPDYAQRYKQREKPELTDEAFIRQDNFTIVLDDFSKRFKPSEH